MAVQLAFSAFLCVLLCSAAPLDTQAGPSPSAVMPEASKGDAMPAISANAPEVKKATEGKTTGSSVTDLEANASPASAPAAKSDDKLPADASQNLAASTNSVTESGSPIGQTVVTTTPSRIISVGRFTNMNREDTRVVDTAGIADPVVFLGPLSLNGGDSAVTRGSFNNALFTSHIEEAPCEDGTHVRNEHVDFLVAASAGGGFYLGSNIFVTVKTFEIPIKEEATLQLEEGKYSSAPVCIAYLQTDNNSGYLHPRVVSTAAASVTVKIEATKNGNWGGSSNSPAKETVGIMCVPAPASGESDYTINLSTFSRKSGNVTSESSFDVSAGVAELVVVKKTQASTSQNNSNRQVSSTATVLSNSRTHGIASVQTMVESDPVHLRKSTANPHQSKFVVLFEEDHCGGNRKKQQLDDVAAILW